MPASFLHGVEVIEIDDGSRPIRTIRSSVIGVIGTAPDSQAEVKASLSTGVVASNNAITWTSKLTGALGNDIAVELVDPAAADQSLAITVSGKFISVRLATNSSKAITTTAAALKTAIEANAAANALVGLANTGASTGAAAVAAVRRVSLSGGIDEAFPLNTPVLVVGSKAKAALLGKTGTLPNAMADIFQSVGALVVVVRVAEGANEAATLANVAGNATNGTGVFAFLAAASTAKVCPKILIAPGWTYQAEGGAKNVVVANLEAVVERLKGFAYVSAPDTSDTAAIAYRQLIGSKRMMVLYPFVTTIDELGEKVNRPADAFFAGIRSKVDIDKGFWWSVSNNEITGIVGTSKAIDFALNDSNSMANWLNENEVTTIISEDGFRTWGNRTCSTDPKWAFECIVRISDIVNESIMQAHLWAVDRAISRTYVEDVADGVNAYLRKLQGQGALTGAQSKEKLINYCWADPDLNTPESISEGNVIWNYNITGVYPAERLTFRSRLTTDGLEEVV